MPVVRISSPPSSRWAMSLTSLTCTQRTRRSSRPGPVFTPATGLQSGEVALAASAEVATAVASAKAAGQEWRSSSLSRRSAVLFAFRELLHDGADELAKIVTAEHGKVLSDAHGE